MRWTLSSVVTVDAKASTAEAGENGGLGSAQPCASGPKSLLAGVSPPGGLEDWSKVDRLAGSDHKVIEASDGRSQPGLRRIGLDRYALVRRMLDGCADSVGCVAGLVLDNVPSGVGVPRLQDEGGTRQVRKVEGGHGGDSTARRRLERLRKTSGSSETTPPSFPPNSGSICSPTIGSRGQCCRGSRTKLT